MVFGNHDDQCGMSKEEQLKIYQSYPGCVAIEGEEMPGCGNYNILIDNPVLPEQPLVLWFLDSGTYAEPGRGTYGYVTEEQNEWMKRTATKILNQYAEPVFYVFQHIPVPQVYDMIQTVSFGTKDAVTCYGPNLGKWYVADNNYIREGKLGEGPCSSEYDSGEFSVWKEVGVRAAFFGHDHLNSYSGTLEGIDLIATPGSGFYLYGAGGEHGTRLVTVHASNPGQIDSTLLTYDELIPNELPGFFASSLGVLIRNYLLMGIASLAVICVLVVLLVRRRRRKKNASI